MEMALERIHNNKVTRDPHLNLQNCDLKNELPAELADCHWLRRVDLSNQLFSPSKGGKATINRKPLNAFSGLEDLSLLQRLPLLDDLSMGSTGLLDIQFIKPLTQLKKVFLSGNLIDDLSPLVPMKGLRSLYLQRIGGADFDTIAAFRNLQILHLDSNAIKDIGFLKDSQSLVDLGLRRNRIRDIRLLGTLVNLEQVNVSDNLISDLDGLQHLKKLRSVSFSENEVRDIQLLYGLRSLTNIYMDNNRIGSLDERFLQYFPDLAVLDVFNNPGMHIPPSVQEVFHKKRFYVRWDKTAPAALPTRLPAEPTPAPVHQPMSFVPFLRIILWAAGVGFVAGLTKHFEPDAIIIGVLIGIVLGFGNEVRR